MRYCDSDGNWSEPDVLQCTSVEFINLENQVTNHARAASTILHL